MAEDKDLSRRDFVICSGAVTGTGMLMGNSLKATGAEISSAVVKK